MRIALAFLIMLCAASSALADLGRMFFTPAQRATLDSARQKSKSTGVGNDEPAAGPPLPKNVSVNGVVQRSDGKTTVWINNRAVTDKQADGMSVTTNKNDSRVRLIVRETGRSIDLKVG